MTAALLPEDALTSISVFAQSEVYSVFSECESSIRSQIRNLNALGLSLTVSFPSHLCIYEKNLEIRRVYYLGKAYTRKLALLYLSIQSEIRAGMELWRKGKGFDQIVDYLRGEKKLFDRYVPVLFHRTQLASSDSDFPYTLPSLPILSLSQTLSTTSEFAQSLSAIHTAKLSAKLLCESNVVPDFKTLFDTCDELSERPMTHFIVTNKKWNTTAEASDFLTAKIYRIRAKLHKEITTRQSVCENDPQIPSPRYASLESYSESCFKRYSTAATDGYWISSMRYIQSSLDVYSPVVGLHYGKALSACKRHGEALVVFKAVLTYLRRNEYDIGSLADAMAKISSEYDSLIKAEKRVKWGYKIAELGLVWTNDAVDMFDITLYSSYALIGLRRFEEAEEMAIRLREHSRWLSIDICNCFGFLYLTWERLEDSENWLQRGIQAWPRNRNNLHLNYSNLCYVKERVDEAEDILRQYLLNLDVDRTDRAYAMASKGRILLYRQRFDEAKDWLVRCSRIQQKWHVSAWEQARTSLLFSQYYYELGDYPSAERHARDSLDSYYEKYSVHGSSDLIAHYRLAAALLALGRRAESESVLSTVIPRTEQHSFLSESALVFRLQGDICIENHQLDQAETALQRAVQAQEGVIPGGRAVALTYASLGRLRLAMGRREQARGFFDKALEIQTWAGGQGIRAAAGTYLGLGELLQMDGEIDKAVEALENGLRMCGEGGNRHPIAGKICEMLERIRAKRPNSSLSI